MRGIVSVRDITVADAAEAVHAFETALALHDAWVDRFNAMLIGGARPARAFLGKEARPKDRFGRGRQARTIRLLVGGPKLAEVDRLHGRLHEVARALAATALDGADVTAAQYRAFLGAARAFRIGLRALLAEARRSQMEFDPLTGVANRLALISHLERERERVRRTHAPSAVCMIDLDRFKEVNDTYGHRAGDHVLKTVASYLLRNVRKYDQVSRYGGEEFVILLPDTPVERAKQVLDRLRRGLKRQRIGLGARRSIRMRASFGIAPLDPAVSAMTSIDRADQAMYAAKQTGRDRVVVWSEGVAAPAGAQRPPARERRASARARASRALSASPKTS